MDKARKLKIEARNSAQNHGHAMGDFKTLWYRYDGNSFTKTIHVAESICIRCGAYVRINTRPAPNEIDIGGNVYGKQCLTVNDNVWLDKDYIARLETETGTA